MIIEARTAGFCFGVKRALKTAYELSENKGICTYGELIHNDYVIKKLEERDVKAIKDLSEAGDATVLIRSHGVEPKIFANLSEMGIPFVDCTCPDVAKIHKIVKKASEEGKSVIIVGSKEHPEVIGTKGWACSNTDGNDNVTIIEDESDICGLDREKKYVLVAQTTFYKEKFDKMISTINISGISVEVFDTICPATIMRQKEAEEISSQADVMLVLGSKKSSNTGKLYEICKKNCKKTFILECIDDLELNIPLTNVKIGLTAGASTPPDIIKEAVKFMNDVEKNNQSFEEMLDESIVTLHTGEVVKGTVIQVTSNEIIVNLGSKSDGIIQRNEYSDDSNLDLTQEVNPGDEIEVYVLRVNDGEGNVLLSKKRLDSQKGWGLVEEAFNAKTPITGKFIDVVKGGMMANICGLRVFVPSSQVSSRYVENLKSFKGKEYSFSIIEFDRSKRRVVAGRKELALKEEQEIKEKVFGELEVGSRVEGVVSRIVDFGAFVDLGGVDGLVHISQMSWGRVKHAKDVVSEGDKVIVTVLDVDKERSKISLSLKDINNDPWLRVTDKYIVGEIVEGRVVRMAPFGAFVELEEGVDGLVHVSQISDKHVPKPEDALTIGEVINVKITEVDPENKRISLSKKAADNVGIETDEEPDSEIPEEVTTEEPASEIPEEVSTEDVAEPVEPVVTESTEEATE